MPRLDWTCHGGALSRQERCLPRYPPRDGVLDVLGSAGVRSMSCSSNGHAIDKGCLHGVPKNAGETHGAGGRRAHHSYSYLCTYYLAVDWAVWKSKVSTDYLACGLGIAFADAAIEADSSKITYSLAMCHIVPTFR